MQINRFFSTTVKKTKPSFNIKNLKKRPVRRTFIDPLKSNLPKNPRLVLKLDNILSTRNLAGVFLKNNKLKKVSASKLTLFSSKVLQKSYLPKPKVVGCSNYFDKRNIFNYYGFYTPHLFSNFELR